jgi:hypothetical protein
VSVARSFLQSDYKTTAEEARRAALRLGDPQAFQELATLARISLRDPITLGLAAGRQMTKALLAACADSPRSADVLTGVGLLGDLAAVRPLVDMLTTEGLAGAAAEALCVITGAPLFEEAVIPEEITEDEMLPGELFAFRERGETPRRTDGQPYGTKVRRVTRDPAVWDEWLQANASRFAAGHRYRRGDLYTPQVLLDCLWSETFPKSYRCWIGDELQIRYGIDLPFEPDLFVDQQQRVLRGAAARIARATTDSEPGTWYYAGHPVN